MIPWPPLRLSKPEVCRENYALREFLLKKFPQHGIGVEIGVHEGDFSAILLARLRPRKLHLIDPWEYRSEASYDRSFYGGQGGVNQRSLDRRYRRVVKRFRRATHRHQVVIHRQRSQLLTDEFPPAYFDWVYVDGDHHYLETFDDLKRYSQYVKPGGWIAGGGYRDDGWWNDDVIRAVEDFRQTRSTKNFCVEHDQFLMQVT